MKRYDIDAVHSIFKRVIKIGLTKTEKDELVAELVAAGYEERNIIIEEK